MYEKLKHTFKKIVPKVFFKKHESFFRSIVALKYRGNKVSCTVCDTNLARFVVLNNGQQLCPKCGSLPRTRRLWELLKLNPAFKNGRVLHFSPPKSLMTAITNYNIKDYTPTDFVGEFEALKQIDIESINETSNSFDIIICYHVLEHVINDEKAMQELFRVLKPGGQCIVQTPFKAGNIYEDYSIVTEDDRLKHFGQKDHVRIYSVLGLVDRLEKNGFKVETLSFSAEDEPKYGYNDEVVLKARKV